jgi:hypothetical protein
LGIDRLTTVGLIKNKLFKKKHLIGGYIIMFYIDMVLKKLRRKMIRYLSHYH